MTHLTEDDLTLLYYGELSDEEAQSARAHVGACASCRARQDSLKQLFAVVDAQAVPEPVGDYEARVWRRLQPALRAARAPRNTGLAARIRQWLVPGPEWVAAGAVAAVVIVAFAAGRYRQPERQTAPATRVAESSAADDLRERILLTALGDHFDRTQAVLVDLASADPSTTVDISGEQRRAHDLLAATRIYRRAASEAGDRTVGDVLESLERVLVEVTVSPSRLTAYQLGSLQRRIDGQELLFKMRVAASSVRERQQSIRRPAVRGGSGA